MDLPLLLALIGAFLPTMPLLWLAAGLHAQAHAQSGQTRLTLLAVSMSLAVAALSWPLLGPLSRTGTLGLVLPLVTAAALAAALALVSAAVSGNEPLLSLRRGLLALCAWIALVASLATALAGTPAALHDQGAWTRCLLGGCGLLLGTALLVWPWRGRKTALRWHIAAAGAMALGLALVVVPAGGAAPWPTVALVPMLLLALAGVIVLRAFQGDPSRLRRAGRSRTAEFEPTVDALTGLATRTRFEGQLERAVLACDAKEQRLALLFVDLDGFKPVNDTFGHAGGDRVLRTVGERLRAQRGEHDLVARVGGDEFLVLLTDDVDEEAAASRARQIIQSLSRPCDLEGRPVTISCSIGIAFYPEGGSPAKLVARADAAMYAAKRTGGAGFAFFTPAMENDARDRFDLLRDLRGALERNELELFYQPKIDAASGKVTAAEALLRWQHPTRGLVSPAVFMPIAERFGLIRDIGQWVIEDACRQARVWQDRGLRMRVAINLSAVQMRQEDIVERIEGALTRHRIDPSRLTCEITESVAMEDTRVTQTTFRELGAAGIHLSIDDFGTGYSSLAYLRKLPAEELKIDRTFITDLEHSSDARAIVDAVLKLAHALGLRVVAEGVENERQRRLLAEMGCDELQGFLFAKPMSARALLLWALDDRQERTDAFATSLFANTQRTVIDPATRALH